MKKRTIITIITILIPLVLISSNISAVHTIDNQRQKEKSNNKTIEILQQFSTPEIKENKEYINIHLKDTETYIANIGEPTLPIVIKTFEFPLGTHIENIQCKVSEINEITLTKKIIPASKPSPCRMENKAVQLEKNNEIYNSNQFYPERWYSYKLAGGLNRDNRHTTFLTQQINPIRYNPMTDTIQFIRSIKIEVTYKEPKNSINTGDEYDLVIICPDRYTSLIKPLVSHKNSHAVRTKLVPLNDIYNNKYFLVQGRDKPEKIKYFIKDAIVNWNITYVMLVGDFRKIPVRYTHLETDAGGVYEELEFVSDLYYADIYDSEGNFSSWDTDNDNIYGEWPYPIHNPMEDIVDLTPDIYIGRLACMHGLEVITMVKKIIDYENNTYDGEWFNTMIVCGGDTFDKKIEGGTDYNEGEVACEKALEFMTGYNPVRIYASLENLTRENIHNEICKGAGFLYFVGHGNPRYWATHVNGDYKNWTEGYGNKHMYKLSNKGMYPILMVGGCHNSEFDVTPLNIIKGLLKEGLDYFDVGNGFGSYWTYNWVLECWSWFFVKKIGGGAIASIGSVGYGGVKIGDYNDNDVPDCIEGADGWFETQFFRLYNEEDIDILGETYGQVVTDYVNNFPVYSDRYDCKIVETHVLLGDPSLKISGYQ